jgi:hypothetical protein
VFPDGRRLFFSNSNRIEATSAVLLSRLSVHVWPPVFADVLTLMRMFKTKRERRTRGPESTQHISHQAKENILKNKKKDKDKTFLGIPE